MPFKSVISLIIALSLVAASAKVQAQIGQVEFISFTSQNDLYQPALQSDKDFTNGLSVVYGGEFIGRMGGRLPGIKLSESINEYALGLNQEMFTPENIRTAELDTTDRPYSGLLYLQLISISNRLQAGRRLISRISVGVQGPASLARETQSWVHGFTNNYVPAGWDNQIGNGLMLDYELTYQHLITPGITYLESSLAAVAHVGTIRNFAGLGIKNRIGWFNSSFANFGGLRNRNQQKGEEVKMRSQAEKGRVIFQNREWQAYVIADAEINYVLYDGTVSGSLIPFEASPYLLDWDQITRFSGATRLGIDLSYGSVQLQYSWLVTGYRVQGSDLTGWGQFRLVVSL